MADENDFSSCSRTYATLCVLGVKLNPRDVSLALGVKASRSHIAGANLGGQNSQRLAKTGGWFLSSKDKIDSLDLRVHLNYLLDIVVDGFPGLVDSGKIDSSKITCFWESSTGNGGPILDAKQMEKLALLGLPLDFDIWFAGDDND